MLTIEIVLYTSTKIHTHPNIERERERVLACTVGRLYALDHLKWVGSKKIQCFKFTANYIFIRAMKLY